MKMSPSEIDTLVSKAIRDQQSASIARLVTARVTRPFVPGEIRKDK
ncbi:hypothetical protein [Fictibacillus macauensis]|nr:hypothetical protein [Fictibacillus macauensis]